MTWAVWLVAAAGIIIVLRIYIKLRQVRNSRQVDWDTQTIDRLRKQGSDPFKDHEVDFFFALPDDQACRAVNAQLEREGYVINIKTMEPGADLAFSLHARKSMRLSVPDMQALSRKFAALASAHAGRYDGWAADVVKQV
jgi:hypothetical protein